MYRLPVADVLTALEAFEPNGKNERCSRDLTLALLRSSDRPFDRGNFAPGHVTASAVVVAPDGGSVLLVFHRRLERWLQPGGHVEPTDGTILGAATRELAEETGLVLAKSICPGPVGLDVHRIPAAGGEPPHLHHDVVFGFVGGPDPSGQSPEGQKVAWCPVADLQRWGADGSVVSMLRARDHRASGLAAGTTGLDLPGVRLALAASWATGTRKGEQET